MAASDYASDVQISGLQNGPYLIRIYGINTADPNWTMSFDRVQSDGSSPDPDLGPNQSQLSPAVEQS